MPTAVTVPSNKLAMTDLNGRSYDIQATKASVVDVRLQHVLSNPWFAAPVQLGTEIAKVLFTDEEFANSMLMGRRVNGQLRESLDAGKLCLVDSLVKQKCGLGEAEFASIRSGIRESLANCCKYLQMKLGPRNTSIS